MNEFEPDINSLYF